MESIVEYSLNAIEDINYFKKHRNMAILKKIYQLVKSIQKSPFEGIGKPEPLKYELTGCWSRRINKQHRLVYEVRENKVFIISAQGHY